MAESEKIMTPYEYRKLKRKLRRFWREWGITKEEALGLLVAAFIMIVLPFASVVFGSLI